MHNHVNTMNTPPTQVPGFFQKIEQSLGGALNAGVGKIGDLLSSHEYYTAPPPPAINPARFRAAIQQNETSVVPGNPYLSKQWSGNPALGYARGAYRVTDGELKSYAAKFLGQPVTPQQFQNSPALQDKYMDGKLQYYAAQGYTPQQIADIHNRGITKSGAPGTTTYQNPKYVQKFNKTYLASTTPRSISELTTP